MLVNDFIEFVSKTDQSLGMAHDDRRDIALYGLVGEIGSLFSAIKKAKLARNGSPAVRSASPEIREEIGDVLWYCVALAQIENPASPDIFAFDVANLRAEIGSSDARADRIGAELGDRRDAFIAGSESFGSAGGRTLGDYQRLAFFTARTEGDVLRGVCMAVLWQLGAEVARHTLPAVELELNRQLNDRSLNKILGEIAWHLAALATLEGASLDDLADEHRRKVERRYSRERPTPLHDDGRPLQERFPRRFEIAFVTIGKGRSRMYLDGRRLGDDLMDNANKDDGYRFHDVMHLAHAAKLGWSPVLRSLMGRKRKSDPRLDEVQDGARARIVEELIVKSIHSEGLGPAYAGPPDHGEPERLFAGDRQVSFRFLTYLGRLCLGLEVEANHFWEWEDAIVAGSDLFHSLRVEGQGTVTLDLDARALTFRPTVYVDLPGSIVGIGSARLPAFPDGPQGGAADGSARADCTRAAMLDALGFDEPSDAVRADLRVQVIDARRSSVKAIGRVQEAMWRKGVVSFRTAWSNDGRTKACTAYAMSDPRDAVS
jgi:NTP pyrophosphatase (non-canonical NTP hydrolase)